LHNLAKRVYFKVKSSVRLASTQRGSTLSHFKNIWFGGLWFMVLNATFNNISVISWGSVLLVKETGENH
jgi:hypothetical protein